MALLSWMTVGIYQQTTDGRRIIQFPPIGPRHLRHSWLVSDEERPHLDARLNRANHFKFFVEIPVVAGGGAVLFTLAELAIWHYLAIVVGVALVTTYLAWHFYVLRGLPRVIIPAAELVPFDNRARELAQMRAMGEPMQVGLIFAGMVMTALQIWVFVEERVWWAGVGTLFLGGATVFMAYRWFALRHLIRNRSSG
jgi:hypothetical protein